MRKIVQIIIIVLLQFLIPSNLIGQEFEWYEFELENIKIDFPSEEVYQLDTIVNGSRLNQLYNQIRNSTLLIQKTSAEKISKDNDLSSLPYDYESLIKYYDGFINGVKNSTNGEKVEKEEIKNGELIGIEYIIYNEIENPIILSQVFLAGNDIIALSVYNPDKELDEINDIFFDSVNFENLDSFEQFTGDSKAYKLGYLLGKLIFYIILGIGIVFLIRALVKKK